MDISEFDTYHPLEHSCTLSTPTMIKALPGTASPNWKMCHHTTKIALKRLEELIQPPNPPDPNLVWTFLNKMDSQGHHLAT